MTGSFSWLSFSSEADFSLVVSLATTLDLACFLADLTGDLTSFLGFLLGVMVSSSECFLFLPDSVSSAEEEHQLNLSNIINELIYLSGC